MTDLSPELLLQKQQQQHQQQKHERQQDICQSNVQRWLWLFQNVKIKSPLKLDDSTQYYDPNEYEEHHENDV